MSLLVDSYFTQIVVHVADVIQSDDRLFSLRMARPLPGRSSTNRLVDKSKAWYASAANRASKQSSLQQIVFVTEVSVARYSLFRLTALVVSSINQHPQLTSVSLYEI